MLRFPFTSEGISGESYYVTSARKHSNIIGLLFVTLGRHWIICATYFGMTAEYYRRDDKFHMRGGLLIKPPMIFDSRTARLMTAIWRAKSVHAQRIRQLEAEHTARCAAMIAEYSSM